MWKLCGDHSIRLIKCTFPSAQEINSFLGRSSDKVFFIIKCNSSDKIVKRNAVEIYFPLQFWYFGLSEKKWLQRKVSLKFRKITLNTSKYQFKRGIYFDLKSLLITFFFKKIIFYLVISNIHEQTERWIFKIFILFTNWNLKEINLKFQKN